MDEVSVWFEYVGMRYNFYLDRMNVPRQSQYGRGRGSYRESQDKAQTPEKGVKQSSFKSKRNIAFDPK